MPPVGSHIGSLVKNLSKYLRFFYFLGKVRFWCLFGYRSKGKLRKNMAESYRNYKQSWLPPMNFGKNWNERFALNLLDEMPVIKNLKLLLVIGFFFNGFCYWFNYSSILIYNFWKAVARKWIQAICSLLQQNRCKKVPLSIVEEGTRG